MTYFPPQSGPCVICGDTNYGLSCGGPTICPKCDCGNFDIATVMKQQNVIAGLREQLAAVSQPEVQTSDAVKLTYIKRWRTIVPLPAKYADEIAEALRASAQEASDRDVLARKIWDADGPRHTGWPSDGYRVSFAHREQYPSEWNRCLHIADAILEIKDGTYVG